MNPFLRAALAALLFGASTPIAKRLLESCGPLTLAGMLYLGGALAMLPTIRSGAAPCLETADLRRRDRQRLLGSVLLGGIAGPALMLLGLDLSVASDVALLLPLETVFTALLAALWFREALGRRAMIGIGVGIAANLILATSGSAPRLAGAALVAAACLCWAFDNHWTARIESLRPAASACAKGFAAGGVNLSLGLWLESGLPSAGAITVALATGAAAYGWSIALYVSAARELGATRAQGIFSAAPLAGVTLAAWWLAEPLEVRHLVAGALLALSLYLIARSRHAHEHEHPALTHDHEHTHDDGHHQHSHDGQPVSLRHSHTHHHGRLVHEHEHWPDVHHRHTH